MGHSILAGSLLLLVGTVVAGQPKEHTLTFEDRVRALKAIEAVYWRHRIWPKENPGAKPSLATVMPEQAIRARVLDYLKKSNALARRWERPISESQLQSELNRIATQTKDPTVTREIFDALNNDPFLIAETLARESLVDRLARNWYSQDQRIHGLMRRRVEDAAAHVSGVESLTRIGGDYTRHSWRLSSRLRKPELDVRSLEVAWVDSDEWSDAIRDLAKRFGIRKSAKGTTLLKTLPLNKLSSIAESADAFSVTMILSVSADRFDTASVTWPKPSFDSWWREVGESESESIGALNGSYALPAVDGETCTDAGWTPTFTEAGNRYGHSAVWTGTEMLIWGGFNDTVAVNTGVAYIPSTDSWRLLASSNAPAPRQYHTAVWTGTEMIVWGGNGNGDFLQSGGRYNPDSDNWRPTTGSSAPSGRSYHSAVWTGTEMIVWGGFRNSSGAVGTGARYRPESDTWSATSTQNAPAARYWFTAIWTGAEMIVWGGSGASTGGDFASGGRYNPARNAWTTTSTQDAPTAREWHTAVWTGTEMIVWGGYHATTGRYLGTGSRYRPTSDTWLPTSVQGAPSVRAYHSAIWSGNEMVVWGGYCDAELGSGARYDPNTDTWIATSVLNPPASRDSHSAVWTGSEMVVFGGYGDSGSLSSAARYSPSSDSWVSANPRPAPSGREAHTAVWSGTELIVWGGYANGPVGTGGRYTAATDSWTSMNNLGAPTPRFYCTAIWTGTKVIVWGGQDNNNALNSGAQYDPQADTWSATDTSQSPSARALHTAAWTGTEMIVWGGSNLNTGSRYNPTCNSWNPTSVQGAPSARALHTAVWTGTEMIVWGGSGQVSGNALNTGGRYLPGSDSWLAITTTEAPTARYWHTAIWTGTEMIVWGGQPANGSLFDTGGRYDPSSDTWTATSLDGAPTPRSNHSAVWGVNEMIVWGGNTTFAGPLVNTGGQYHPESDSWTATSLHSAPSRRRSHAATWTGAAMIVWGGYGDIGPYLSTGGLLCACTTPRTFYKDFDGDGYGDLNVARSPCDGMQPAGYVLDASDCDDTNAQTYPGAPQLCDGINNNCADAAWPLVPANEADADYDDFRLCQNDCNDVDATVYPGAPQLCDGNSNNCDDPAWPAVPANEADTDHDGQRICAGDCNDGDPSVYAGAMQICDGTNNDCSEPTWPTIPSNETDADGDGYRICQNDCNDASTAIHPGAIETCNGIDDNCNGQINEDAAGVDSDADGVRNACDNCRFAYNPDQLESDGDGIGNACDNCVTISNLNQADTDSDGRGNACDNCPLSVNAFQDDFDGDRVGDVCDNCIFDWNATQADFDHDGQGDICDIDDGLTYIYATDPDYREWQAESGYTFWNSYRGSLAVLRATGQYTQAPGSSALAAHDCGLNDNYVFDPMVPNPGEVAFNLVTGVAGGVESGLGTNSAGVPRSNTNPCP